MNDNLTRALVLLIAISRTRNTDNHLEIFADEDGENELADEIDRFISAQINGFADQGDRGVTGPKHGGRPAVPGGAGSGRSSKGRRGSSGSGPAAGLVPAVLNCP